MRRSIAAQGSRRDGREREQSQRSVRRSDARGPRVRCSDCAADETLAGTAARSRPLSAGPPPGRELTAPGGGRAALCYAALAVVAEALARWRFSATNLLAMKVAPCGSAMTAIRTHGASNGATRTVPPSSLAFAAVASASATANVTLQYGLTSGGSSAMGLSDATTSAKPSGAPACD